MDVLLIKIYKNNLYSDWKVIPEKSCCFFLFFHWGKEREDVNIYQMNYDLLSGTVENIALYETEFYIKCRI